MTYEIYRYIFIGGAALAVLMLIISVILFFVYRIPSVVGDLTGRTARKAIEDIRNQNESSGNKVYKTSHVNRQRGKLTDKISPSGNLIKNPSEEIGGAMSTEKISTQELPAEETTVLGVADETTVLEQIADETTVLAPTNNVRFVIEYEITYIHTDEVIA